MEQQQNQCLNYSQINFFNNNNQLSEISYFPINTDYKQQKNLFNNLMLSQLLIQQQQHMNSFYEQKIMALNNRLNNVIGLITRILGTPTFRPLTFF